MINEYTYVVADISELDNIDYTQVLQTSSQTVRKNIEGTRFILKFIGSTPSTVEDLDLNNKLISYDDNKSFTHPQILSIISDIEWRGTQSIL